MTFFCLSFVVDPKPTVIIDLFCSTGQTIYWICGPNSSHLRLGNGQSGQPEVYRDEVIKLIQPHSGFQFRGTKANLEQLEGFSMVEMGKSIKALAPDLWNLLGVLLDADPARRRAAPNIGGSHVNEDVEMDLGEIGMEGSRQNEREENWADLDAEAVELSDSEDDEEDICDDILLGAAGTILDPLAAGSDSESDVEKETTAPKQAQKKRRRKQKPEKRNAVLIAIVSLATL